MMSSSVTSHPSASSCQYHHRLLHHSPRELCTRCYSHPGSYPTDPGTILLPASMNPLVTWQKQDHATWYFVSGLFHLAWCFQDLLMLKRVSKYSPFKSLNSIYCANSLCPFITNGHFNWNGKILLEAKN